MRLRIGSVGLTAALLFGVSAPSASAEARSIDWACPDGWALSFADVDGSSVHGAAVECIAAWGISRGSSSGLYSPAQYVTRAQMATFVARTIVVSGGYLDAEAPDAFADDDGNTHEIAINALSDAGIVAGGEDGAYRPDAFVTRAQMATFLVRAFEYEAAELPPGPDAFVDDDGNPHEFSIDKAAEAGFAAGTTATTFAPSSFVRRDAMASFLARMFDKLVADGYSVGPPIGPPSEDGGEPPAPPSPPGAAAATATAASVTPPPGSATAASISWSSYGTFQCEGVANPTAYAPSLWSSGYAAWIPEYVWFLPNGQRVSEYGQWLWSYQGSGWQYFSSDAFYPPGNYTGSLAVRNWVYDYDTGEWWNTWSVTAPNILGYGGGQYYCYFNGWGLPGAGI